MRVAQAKGCVCPIEALEARQLLSSVVGPEEQLAYPAATGATFSVNSVRRVFNDVIGGSPSLSRKSRYKNVTSKSVTIPAGGVTITGADASMFHILNDLALPRGLKAGKAINISIEFDPPSGTPAGIKRALLTVTTTAGITKSVRLRGIATTGLGGANQPGLTRVLRAFDIPTFVGQNETSAYYPNPPGADSQEVLLQKLQKAGTGPVVIEPLASFTAQLDPPYTLGTYTPGSPTTSRTELFHTPADQFQTTNVVPTGTTTFDPGSATFGFYFLSNVQVQGRIGYTEDSLNTWDTTNPRKFRFFPLENHDKSIVPNAYVLTSTEWDSPAGYDFTNLVAIIRNVKAAAVGTAKGAQLTIADLNALPGASNMIFNRIQNQNATLGDQQHDVGTVRLLNTGTASLVVNSYSISPQWQLVSPPTFPLTIPVGSSRTLQVKFIANSEPAHAYNQTNGTSSPNGGGVWTGVLSFASNDANSSTRSISLAGWWQNHSEQNEEPSLQTLVNLMAGWKTNINSTPVPELTESLNVPSSPTYYGEETVAAYFTRADTSQPVGVTQLNSFHSQGFKVPVYWYAKGSSTTNKIFTIGSDTAQMLFPYLDGTTTAASGAFTPSGTFGFKVDTEWADDSKNSIKTAGGHHFRFYPLRDSSGNIVANTYIMTMDYSNLGGENFDFQDNVYIVTNIKPA